MTIEVLDPLFSPLKMTVKYSKIDQVLDQSREGKKVKKYEKIIKTPFIFCLVGTLPTSYALSVRGFYKG